jgi:hypothetical protein
MEVDSGIVDMGMLCKDERTGTIERKQEQLF